MNRWRNGVIFPTHPAYLSFRSHYWCGKPSPGCEFFVESPLPILFEKDTPGTMCFCGANILWDVT